MANELTQEQVMAQLMTRGFESGGFGTPLRHFRGKLDSITGSMVQRGNMPQPKLEVIYTFSELDVIESTEPYPFPVAQISIMHSNRTKSNMGILGASIDKVVNAGLDANAPQSAVRNQDYLIGKMQEWKMTPGHMMWDNDKKTETPRDCWEVVWVEGEITPVTTPTGKVETSTPVAKVAITPAAQALSLLEGKTQQQWNNMVFQDPLVKGDANLISAIVNNTFIPALEAAGSVTKDGNGVYHLAKKG